VLVAVWLLPPQLSKSFSCLLLSFSILLSHLLCPCSCLKATMAETTASFRRGLVPTKLGLIHYTAVGPTKPKLLPIIGFHMSPRSVDEYYEIMIECTSTTTYGDNQPRLFVAMDEFGYGQSNNPLESCTLDDIADCFLQVLDHLEVSKCIVAGNLMGCYIALSLASRYPDRVKGVVCSNLYHFQPEAREKALREEAERLQEKVPSFPPDSWELKDDGSHINEIFGKRSSWLSTELNTRATLDNLNYLVKRRSRYSRGVHIQDGGAFLLQDACFKVKCPVMCINGAGAVKFFDMIGMEMSKQFDEVCGFFPSKPKVSVLEPPGASINMLNENAKEWYGMVVSFAQDIESTI